MAEGSTPPQDPYCYPGTDVLVNKLGLRSAEELQAAETAAVVLRDTELRISPLPGPYDLEHLQRFHKKLFSDIYPWAGRLRSIDISKGASRFGHHAYLETYLGGILTELATEKLLMGLSADSFTERLAYYLGEVNAAHPFREGNGRTQRAFFRQLGAAAGYRLSWNEMDRDENLSASAASLAGNPEPLKLLLSGIIHKI